ncbi:MAG TPA: hypothetical protein PKE63_09820 [Lacibacter sp.]|nr:hypothetical protein [Lacibacter sp.]HMO87694.1 hypothetical protein [Lacibacter sp.]HMP87563.1 hypothetical protein [Lacibacter sp.]
MRTCLYQVAVLLVLLSACRKKAGEEELPAPAPGKCNIAARLSGTVYTLFTTIPDESSTLLGGEIFLYAEGVKPSPFAPAAYFEIILPLTISPGTYNQAAATASGIIVVFYDAVGNQWINGGAPAAGFVLTVSRRTATEVVGTFSGPLYSFPLGSSVTISNGRFYGRF